VGVGLAPRENAVARSIMVGTIIFHQSLFAGELDSATTSRPMSPATGGSHIAGPKRVVTRANGLTTLAAIANNGGRLAMVIKVKC